MKYGLRKDDNLFKEPKKKWRKAMEDLTKRLEFEVKLLKGQLEEATDRIKQLEPKNPKINIFFTEERETQHCSTREVRYQDTLEWESNRPNQLNCITAMPEYRHQSLEELRFADYSIAGPHQHQLFIDFGLNNSVVVFTGTEYGKYGQHGIWDVDPLTWVPFRYNTITVLPEYKNKSFEELRLEDYILKALFSNTTRFEGIRSTSADSFSLKQKKKLSTAGFCNKDSGVSDPVRNKHGDSRGGYEDYDSSHRSERGTRSSKSEELFDQMLLSLSKMETHLSDVKVRLSSMDSHMSDLNSQVSVMDSRLSAVDMFVAVERVNKKWQGLEPQLANLDTPPKKNIESPTTSTHSQEDNNSPLLTPPTTVASEVPVGTKSLCESESPNVIKSSEKNYLNLKDISLTSTPNDSLGTIDSNFKNISLTLSTPNDSFDKIDSKSISSQTQTSEDFLKSDKHVENSFSQDIKIENDYSKENLLVSSKFIDLIERSSTKTCSVEVIDSINLEGKTSHNTKENHDLQLVLKSQNSETDTRPNKSNSQNSLVRTDIVPELGKETNNENSCLNTKKTNINDLETCVATEAQSLIEEGNTSDSDYVIVEKKDFDDDTGGNEQCSSKPNIRPAYFPVVGGTGSSIYIEDKNYKLCSNITEYLEENLGKKKDVVYEFGFEVRPDFSGTDSLLEETSSRSESDINKDSSRKNESVNSIKDDSFSTFLTRLTEKHHERPNQSSPIVQKLSTSGKFGAKASL